MNLMATAPDWLIILFCLTLAVAAAEDAIRLRISNILVVAVAAGAIVAIFAQGPSFALWQNIAFATAILAAGTAFFSAGAVGGGDVKLFAAVALWVDLGHAPVLLAAVFIAGGLLAAAMLSLRLLPGRGGGAGLKASSRRIPYGIAIASGALFLLALQQGPANASRPNPLDIHSLEKPPARPR